MTYQVSNKSEHPLQYLLLKNFIKGDFFDLLKKYQAIIAGGAIRAVLAREKISDLDLYFPTEFLTHQFLYEARSKYPEMITTELKTDNAVSFSLNDKKIQVITCIYGNPTEIIEFFDFTVCSAAFDVKEEQFTFHPTFFKDLASKTLRIHNNLKYPLATVHRVVKYLEKGYHISPTELVKLVIQCHEIKIDNKFEWKRQLLGIDTVYLSKIFDSLQKKNEDFQISEMLTHIDTYLQEQVEDYE